MTSRSIYVPANELAVELGNVRMANVILLGAMLGMREVVSLKGIERTLESHLPEERRKIIEPNKRALARGVEYVRSQK